MNGPWAIFQPVFIHLGWALIHLLWQGLIVAAALEIALALVGNTRARARYLLCGVALAALPVCFAVTFWQANHESPAPPPMSAEPTAERPQASTLPDALPSADGLVLHAAPALVDLAPRPSFSRDWNQLMPFVGWGWLAGVVILSVRKAGGLIVLWRLRRRGVTEPDGAMMELFRRACGRIGIDPRRVGLKISDLVRVPMTMGWLSPVVLFPAALASGLSPGEIELIFAHELAHVRRWDYLVNLLQAVVETLFFYHPLTWWISRRMRRERENCCDDLVAQGPQEKLAYARTLLRLEELCAPDGALVTAANGGVLRRRIERLAGEVHARSANGGAVLLFLVAALAGLAAHSAAQAQVAAADQSVPALTAAEAKTKGIAAAVNGKAIHWADLPVWGNPSEPMLRSKYRGIELEQKLAEARLAEREDAINRELIVQDAEASGYQVPQEDLDDRVDFGMKGFHGSKEAFEQNLEKNGLTLEKFNQRNREDLLWTHEWGLKVDAPTKEFIKNTPGYAAMTKEQKNDLYATESTKLENELLDNLRAKSIIQRFDDQLGIAAMVDGHVITTVELEQQWKSAEDNLRANYAGDALKAKLTEMHKTILHALIDRQLMIEDYKAQGGSIPKSFADAQIDDIIRDQYGGSRTSFLQVLADRGTSEENYRREIEENAIVGISRTKFVEDKMDDYYAAHLDLFPADEQLRVTLMEIKGSKPVPEGHIGDFASDTDPRAEMARQILRRMQAGEDVSAVPATEGVNQKEVGRSVWVTQDRFPGWWPIRWDRVEKLKPGETTGVVVGDGSYSYLNGPNQNYHYYYIVRLDERRPARVAATGETTRQKQALLDAESNRLHEAWLGPLRAKAKVQIFDPELAVDPWATEPARAMPVNAGPGAVNGPATPIAPTAPATRVGSMPAGGASVPKPNDEAGEQGMRILNEKLSLTPEQSKTLQAAREAVVQGTATKTVDEVLKEILSARQEAAWEKVKEGAILADAGSAASNETQRIAEWVPLSDAQKKQLFDALYPTEVKYLTTFRSTAEMGAAYNRKLEEKDAALAHILTPGQMLIYDQQAKADLRRNVASPLVIKDYTPAPTPQPLDQSPDVSLPYATLKP